MNIQSVAVAESAASRTITNADVVDLFDYLSRQGINPQEMSLFRAGEQAKLLANPANFGGIVLNTMERMHIRGEQIRNEQAGDLGLDSTPTTSQAGPARLHPGRAADQAGSSAEATIRPVVNEMIKVMSRMASHTLEAELLGAIASQLSRTSNMLLRGQ